MKGLLLVILVLVAPAMLFASCNPTPGWQHHDDGTGRDITKEATLSLPDHAVSLLQLHSSGRVLLAIHPFTFSGDSYRAVFDNGREESLRMTPSACGTVFIVDNPDRFVTLLQRYDTLSVTTMSDCGRPVRVRFDLSADMTQALNWLHE